MPKCICVIDGQGGGIGVILIKTLREAYGDTVQLIALGTNALATAQMLKAILLVESPIPFRRRNLFVSANALSRV